VSTWILLRGLTREVRHWGDFPQSLQAALPDAEIHAIELPGAGRLHMVKSPTTIDAIAVHCRNQVLAQGLRPPFHILAMSLGAMVAAAWANAHPEELAGCVLINTSLRPFSPFHHRLRPSAYAALSRLLLPMADRMREAVILHLTSSRAAELAEVLDAWVTYRREQPVTLSNTLRQLFAAMRYQAPATRPAVRLLVLTGSRDMLVDPECSSRLAKDWQADYAEHPGAGHDLPLDDGEWVVQQISRWLKSLA